MTVADDAAQPGAGWDEGQCTAALALLEQRQAQVGIMLRLRQTFRLTVHRSTTYAWQYHA